MGERALHGQGPPLGREPMPDGSNEQGMLERRPCGCCPSSLRHPRGRHHHRIPAGRARNIKMESGGKCQDDRGACTPPSTSCLCSMAPWEAVGVGHRSRQRVHLWLGRLCNSPLRSCADEPHYARIMFMHTRAAQVAAWRICTHFFSRRLWCALVICPPSMYCALFRLHSAPPTLKTTLGPVGLHLLLL